MSTPCGHPKEDHSRHGELHVHRPGGRSVLGVFKEEQTKKCSYCRESKGKVVGDEVRAVGREQPQHIEP